jgi:5-methylcytosine-specific restriction enzyme subunit McrC
MSNLINLFEYEKYEGEVDLTKIDLQYFKTEYKNGKNYLKAKQFVGVVQFGDTKICVYPKIYSDKNPDLKVAKVKEKVQMQSMQNFLFMMQYAYKIHNVKDYQTSVEHKKFDILEILIYIFAKNLMDLLKVNLNRSYIIVEDDSNFLKGSWRISEQLSRMPHIKHRFLVSYDEFTENNPLNRILKFVSFMLLRFSKNNFSRTLLHNILLLYAEVDDISKPGRAYLELVKFNRMNQEFSSIFAFARMFLDKLAGDFSNIKHTNFSFMFDMNLLFEQFIAEFIRRENLIPQGLNMETQTECRYLDIDKKAFMLKPDISFWENGTCKLIIDTKYKLLDENKDKRSYNDQDEKYKGVSGKDAQQMYAYAKKYDCQRVVLLYPEILKTDNKVKNNICLSEFDFGDGKQLKICTVDICRDLKNEKESLNNEMKGIFDG